MSRIVVPEGMYLAALKHQDSEVLCGAALEAALRWLSENPIVPSPAIAREFIGRMVVLNETSLIFVLEAWQRRMFLAQRDKPLMVHFPSAGRYEVEVFDDKPPCLRAVGTRIEPKVSEES